MKASVRLDTDHNTGEIDPRIFGGFLEHLGRAVYEGVYDPGNPLSDDDGFRTDVIDALGKLRMPCVRYPGGNFVSNYDWRDGIGPRDQRPSRPDFAWKSVDPNTFGVDEFVAWCRTLNTEPMMAVNLGTLGPAEASALVEYCNLESGTSWSDMRRQNGHDAPHGIDMWCLGNEMDGPWQAGHVPAQEYAMRAQQAARLMKGIDPNIELVLCGSSGRGLDTYLEWDRIVLEYCWEDVDYISAHRYSRNTEDDSAWFLAEGVEIERILSDYDGLVKYVRGVKKSDKKVYVSFDEWNVWYKVMQRDGGWSVAPHMMEEVYNLEDALICAQYLNAFIRHADLVKIACLAQIVNVIAPILTSSGGLLIQSTFYPFQMFAERAKGVSLIPVV
ncbi:MAG: alpha-L-arabinofuranosidase C-terminal domain-containing protein, partial [SAR202 cluster bacterium]|nr:alpha-L-arabinofuranosidase C-terminal domain-containing protein [SAR202 cluster bacterium]